MSGREIEERVLLKNECPFETNFIEHTYINYLKINQF